MKNSRQATAYRELRRKILKGDYAADSFLPSLRHLAEDFDVSVTPVYQAARQLADEGLLEMVHGAGIRVSSRWQQEDGPFHRAIVHYLGVNSNYRAQEVPGPVHLLRATSDWLLWELTHSRQIATLVAHFPPGDENAFIERLRDVFYSDAAVVVFADPEDFSDEARSWIDKLLTAGRHVVYMGSRIEVEGCDCVRGEFQEGSRQLTRYLLSRGHRHILRLHHQFTQWFERQKQRGFEMALRDWAEEGHPLSHGILRSAAAVADPFLPHEVETALNKSILADALAQAPITAVMAVNDPAAILLRIALHELGRPDIEVVGYDASWTEVPLSQFILDRADQAGLSSPPATVDSSFRLSGVELAKLAMARALGTLPPEPQIVQVPHRLALQVAA